MSLTLSIQSGEYGTGHPVKCGPAARKTGTQPERAKASLGITSPEYSDGSRLVAISKESLETRRRRTTRLIRSGAQVSET